MIKYGRSHEADRQAAMTDGRLSHESVFRNVRSAIHEK